MKRKVVWLVALSTYGEGNLLAFRPFEALPVLPEIKVAHNHEPYHTVGAHGTIQGPTLRLLAFNQKTLIDGTLEPEKLIFLVHFYMAK